ncbi:alpha-D-ribose 1-methylphosphonate 5-phosphate C-P-lyase PhnJ [Bacillaceae bacterium Marseille-Q3522]|nr:alpha-D-ribose 1-methylphosphonate 5-phosphate C-P-lyase PhnJ [Bacillaceae bacterium Marseille-Q3522]
MMQLYNYGFLDEGSKKEIRRSILKAISIPGYQVPFASREMPIGRGWGTGGLQITLSLIGEGDCLKVIDQGHDDSVNAVSIKRLVKNCTNISTTTDSEQATIIQTRHRIPEIPLRNGQILVLQVPLPEPLRRVEAKERETKRMHGEMDYSSMYVKLYEDIVRWGEITIGADYPAIVNHRYLINPSPIPRYDLPKLHHAEGLYLFGAGREKKIYAVPPYTNVEPLQFADYPFEKEQFHGHHCRLCGSSDTFLDEIYEKNGEKTYQCSDTGYCEKKRLEGVGQG